MGYVIAGILVLLIVSAFVVFLVMNAANKGGPDPKGDGPPGIGADEGTPLGDTSEHAGEQSADGTTERDPEGAAGTSGGGRPDRATGGEAEGGRAIVPESERLADRPR